MKVLLVGGGSLVARAVAASLGPEAKVITAGRSGCDIALDLRSPVEQMVLPEGLDAVVNTAADFGGEGPDDFARAEEVNALGALRLCQACARGGVRYLLHVSTIFVRQPVLQSRLAAYVVSKRHGEEMVRQYCAGAGLPLGLVRPSQLYGDGEEFRRHQPLLYAWADKARLGEPIVIFGPRDAKRNYLHIDDLGEIVACMVRMGLVGEYDCQHPEDVSLSQIAEALIGAFGGAGRVEFAREMPPQEDVVFAPDSRIFERTGHYPAISPAEGMRRIAARMGRDT